MQVKIPHTQFVGLMIMLGIIIVILFGMLVLRVLEERQATRLYNESLNTAKVLGQPTFKTPVIKKTSQ